VNNTLHDTFDQRPGDGEIAARAQAIFTGACDSIDSYHARRLDLARRQAVHGTATRSALRMWAPLAGAAACCVLVIGVVWMRPASQVAPAPRVTTEIPGAPLTVPDAAAAVDVGSGQADMVQDLDFYRWLAAQPAVAMAPGASGR
jgi:hypothetical protein